MGRAARLSPSHWKTGIEKMTNKSANLCSPCSPHQCGRQLHLLRRDLHPGRPLVDPVGEVYGGLDVGRGHHADDVRLPAALEHLGALAPPGEAGGRWPRLT